MFLGSAYVEVLRFAQDDKFSLLQSSFRDSLKFPGAIFKMSRLGECFTAAFGPVGDPGGHLFIRDARFAEKLKRFLCVAKKRVGRFDSFESDGLAETCGKIFSDAANAKKLGASDVQNKRGRRRVEQGFERDGGGIGLPDGVEISHGKSDGFAGMDALGNVDENAVAEFGGVVEAEDGGFDVCGAAEVFEDAFAAETTHGVFADGIERIGFFRATLSDRREAVDISGGERGDSTVAKTIGDEAGEK